MSNVDCVYRPGNTVEGAVAFELTETLKCRSVRIAIEGAGSTKWLLSEGNKTSHARSREIPYSAKTKYVWTEVVAWKPSTSITAIEKQSRAALLPGSYSFPFSFPLPTSCPPSFEGTHGHVRYLVRAVIERSWKSNRSEVHMFTVLPPTDLNTLPHATLIGRSVKSKFIGVFPFRHGVITMDMCIEKRGLVPGETLKVEVVVQNHTNRPVVRAECFLVQQCRYVAYRYGMGVADNGEDNHELPNDAFLSRKLDEIRIAASTQDVCIDPRSEKSLRMSVKIPCTVPTFASTLIDVEYNVVAKLHIKCRFRNTVKCECGVILGTVPLLDQNDPDNPIEPRTPTYEEAISSCLSSTPDDEKFAPRYVFYPNFGKNKPEELEIDASPPQLDLGLPPIDTISIDS